MPFADLGAIRLYYEASGEGTPTILIPGWTLNTHLWDGVETSLGSVLKVIKYDVRGAGQSISDPSLEYSRAADIEDLAAFMDHLRLERAHLVGHSKGARIACMFSMLYPHKVLSVTAIGSAEPHGVLEGARSFRPIAQAWVIKARDMAAKEGIPAALTYLAQSKLFGRLRTSVEGVRRLHRAMEGYAGADLISLTPRREIDLSHLAPKLTMPVQFVVGDEDPFLPECRYAHSLIPGSDLVILRGSGHMVTIEKPDVVAAQILQFIASTSPIAAMD